MIQPRHEFINFSPTGSQHLFESNPGRCGLSRCALLQLLCVENGGLQAISDDQQDCSFRFLAFIQLLEPLFGHGPPNSLLAVIVLGLLTVSSGDCRTLAKASILIAHILGHRIANQVIHESMHALNSHLLRHADEVWSLLFILKRPAEKNGADP